MLHKRVPALLILASATAFADDPPFGPQDVQTLFFFSKSDDRNRVDYGLKLDASCAPVGDEPVFPYWREFEGGAEGKRTHTLKFFEYAGYGIAEQKIKKFGARYEIALTLKALPKEITVQIEKGEGGKCTVTNRAKIAKTDGMELVSCYIKLKFGWSPEYVDVKGRDPKTGKDVTERLNP